VIVGASPVGLIVIVAVFALLWFVLIRPQRARQQAQRTLHDTIAPGDEVLTVGGIYGIVQDVDEEGDLIVEIAEGIHVRVARRAVATVVKPDDEDEEGHEHEAGEGHEARETHDGGPTGSSLSATVTDEDASLEATQKRLFGRRS
jgi:preprotein translocase subunit YajC